jgi:serine/threonine-protein kinase RsbW
VRAVLGRLMMDLAALGLNPRARIDAEIVLAEVLNNIAEHAYHGAGGWVRLALVTRPGGTLVCIVVDAGRPMPDHARDDSGCGHTQAWPMAVPDGAPDCTSPARAQAEGAALSEGGFGLALIAALAPDGRYVRRGGANWLRLMLRAGRQPSADICPDPQAAHPRGAGISSV